MEGAFIFGSIFTYHSLKKEKKKRRKDRKKNEKRNLEAVPVTRVASSEVTERNIFG